MTINAFPIQTRRVDFQKILDAEGHAIQVEEDAAQTALDRIATAGDRIQTGADRVQTTSDRISATASQNAAAGSATTATTQAGIATTQAGIATTQANNAVAVVTGGTASLTAAAGRIPIADANAELDASWMTGIANNAYPIIRPTLDLDFINGATVDPRITFTRASTTTYYDGKTFAKAEENLLTFSQEFDNTAWVRRSLASVTANATTAPDGTMTADKLVADAGTGFKRVRQSLTAAAGVVSVFAKASEINGLWIGTADGNAVAVFDILNGTVISGTGTITAAGDGWYRCVAAFADYSATGPYIGLYNGNLSFTGDGTSGIFLWGAQLEARSAATAYTPTTTRPITRYQPVLLTAPANTAVIDHDPVTGARLGLRVWEARTNLLLRSEEFDNAAWGKFNATVLPNQIIAPDGTLSADLVNATSTTINQGFVNVVGPAAFATYTLSAYVKQNNSTGIQLQPNASIDGVNSGVVLSFNFLNASVTSSAYGGKFTNFTATSTDLGNGWFRLTLTYTTTGTNPPSSTLNRIYPYLAGDAVNSSAYIWGAQLEAGNSASPYIPTTTAQVTRAADVASMTGANFSSWYRQDEGTLFASMSSTGTAGGKLHGVFLYGSPETSYMGIYHESNATLIRVYTAGFVNQSLLNLGSSSLSTNAALAYKTNDIAASQNGGSALTDPIAELPYPVTMRIGWNQVNGQGAGGHIRHITYYPSRLSNATLQAITKP